MEVERIMAVLISGNEVVGHAKLCKIKSRISAYISCQYIDLTGCDMVLGVGGEYALIHSPINGAYTPLDISVCKLNKLDVVVINSSNNEVKLTSNNLTTKRIEELVDYYTNARNAHTYMAYSEDNDSEESMTEESDNSASSLTSDASMSSNATSIDASYDEECEGEDNRSTDKALANEGASSDARDGVIIGDNNDNSESERAKPPFQDTIAVELDDLFSRYEHETMLEESLPNSKFVRIFYDDNNYYVVGRIEPSSDTPCIICYGYPGEGGTTPPKAVSEDWEWLPIDKKNPSGSGYYMMYQNGENGEVLRS